MPNLKLKRLAEAICDSLDCLGYSDGTECEPDASDADFETHAYDQTNIDGTQGCLHCMAVDALRRPDVVLPIDEADETAVRRMTESTIQQRSRRKRAVP